MESPVDTIRANNLNSDDRRPSGGLEWQHCFVRWDVPGCVCNAGEGDAGPFGHNGGRRARLVQGGTRPGYKMLEEARVRTQQRPAPVL